MRKVAFLLILLLSFQFVAKSQETNPYVKRIWKDSILNYVQQINGYATDNYTDLEFLKHLLKDKQYVFLGESSHEVEEYFQIKNRLVQFLYNEMGYKIIAFESYKVICLEANGIKNEISIDSLFSYCFAYQHDIETPKGAVSFLRFFKKSDIITTSFDIDLERPLRFQQIIRKNYPNVPDTVLVQDSIITSHYNKKEALSFKGWESVIYDTGIFDLSDIRNQEIHDAIINRSNWLYHMPNNTFTKRDSVMARNIIRLINDFYPNEKIIFWAHNEHISKYSPELSVMNEFLPDSIIDKSYILGLYGYQGNTGVRDSGPVNLVKNKRNSLGAIINSAGYEIAFCDFSRQTKTAENSWMFQKVKSISWAVQRPVIIPYKRYDGIIQIKNIHATTNKE
jgi:erythromycin esterase